MDTTPNLSARPRNIGEAICLDFRTDLERALGYELISGHLSFGNFLMAVKEDVVANDKLREAFMSNPLSAVAALTFAAQCKLLPGGRYEQFYLIPRSRKGRMEVSPMLGYKGLLAMAQRHPRVHSVDAFLVYEGEHFECDPGQGRITHQWRFDIDRSIDKVQAVYAKAVLRDPETKQAGGPAVLWPMSVSEVLAVRAKSDAWKYAEQSGRRDSPWHTHPDKMFRKTAVRALLAGGSVPRDYGMGGVLQQDASADAVEEKPLALPAVDANQKARLVAGLDKEEPPFDFMEEAVQAIRAAPTEAALKRLAPRWQHFIGGDAADIARAYEDRLGGLL